MSRIQRTTKFEAFAVAPAPSGADDTSTIQKVYEGLGKAGHIVLQKGTYKFDTTVKFNKYAVWLQGQGASSMEVNSNIVTASTLVTCNSRNKAAIEVSQSGSSFSDFALLNNANLELGTLSEALSSSGAAITEIKVNALAEAIPKETRITTLSGAGPFELGTLSETLSTVAPITKFKVNALAGTIPAENLKGALTGATKVTLNDGAGHTQVFTLTAEALAGATEVKVESLKPNFAYPLTTTKVEGGSFYQQWVTSAEAAKSATAIKVESQKPNFSYANAAKFEGGPFPGSYGIISNRLNEKGEETTEGNSRGRYWNLDIEGFNINHRSIAGFECRYSDCTFNGAVKYGFQYGDPNNVDAGGLFIVNCSFIALKRRKIAAHFRWESGGGIFINNCSFVFNKEEIAVAQLPEYCTDFFFEPPAKKSTSNLSVNACHIEGWEKDATRFFCSTGESVTLINCSVTACEYRSFQSTFAGRIAVAAECAATGHLQLVAITGNRFNIEDGKSGFIKNVNGYSYNGNVGNVGLTIEPTTQQLGYPIQNPTPTSTTFGVLHAGLSQNYWLLLYPELKPGELAEYRVESGLATLGTVKDRAPEPRTYGYLETGTTAGVEITELKTRALIYNVPSGIKIKVVSFENAAIFTEFKTTAESKVGETKIAVEKINPETIPALSPVEAVGPEKYLPTHGPFFFTGSQEYKLERLDTNTYTMLQSKIIAP